MKVSIITCLSNQLDYVEIIKHNYNGFLYNRDDLELIVIDDGPKDLSDQFSDLDHCNYIYLSRDEIDTFTQKIIDEYKGLDNIPLLYQKKIHKLPSGFKRDYGVGLSEHEYIFHMDSDCIYDPKAIDRKLRFLKKTSSECIYCDSMLCYDIYNKQIYKTISDQKIYESTLFHTREFWKRKGFKWSDIECEGRYFHYNNGVDRKMDNYYDTIQLLSIHNLHKFKPIKVELDIEIKIPEIVDTLQKHTNHPMKDIIDNLYSDKVSILGIESEFLKNVTDERWNVVHIEEKCKEKKILKMIEDQEFHLLLFGSKKPIWSLFENKTFEIIIVETSRNYDQMDSIILGCKKNEYIKVNGFYILKSWISK